MKAADAQLPCVRRGCAKIVRSRNVLHISTGDMLRAEVKEKTTASMAPSVEEALI